jgi:hypothetical protein
MRLCHWPNISTSTCQGKKITYVGRLPKLESSDGASLPAIRDEKERAFHLTICSVGIVPSLAIAIDGSCASSIEVDVLTTKQPPRRAILEWKLKSPRKPTLNVVTELDSSSQSNIDMLEESQVQLSADGVLLIKDHSTTVVALLEGT